MAMTVTMSVTDYDCCRDYDCDYSYTVTTVSKIIVGICDQRRCYHYCCYSLPFLVDYLLMVLITLHMHFALTDGM